MPVSICGTISYIRSDNSNIKNGHVQFVLDSSEKVEYRQANGQIICDAIKSYVHINTPVEVTGEWNDGILCCTDVHMTYLSDSVTAQFLKDKCKGIGAKKAELLVDFYHDTLFSLSKTELYDSLVKNFPKFREDSILSIIDETHIDNEVLHKLENELLNIKVPYDVITTIYGEYGRDSLKKLSQNPYNVAFDLDISFDLMDSYAMQIGIMPFDIRRLKALCLHALKRNEDQGHTYILATELAKRVSLLSEKSVYKTPIDASITSTIVCLLDSVYFDAETNEVSFTKTRDREIAVAKRLIDLMTYISDIEVFDKDIDYAEQVLGIKYGNDQRNAFHCLEHTSLNIVTGGPGTGKTTTINGIIQVFQNKRPNAIVKLVAPTGRAAKRLSESTSKKTSTIHKLLECKAYEGIMLHKSEGSPIECDMLIIDESSMVDLELMDMLLSAIKLGTMILIVGDEDQLPSIGAGNILHDMITSGVIPIYRLNENYRQGKSGIYEASCDIKEGKVPRANNSDVFIYKVRDEQEGYSLLCQLMDQFYNNNDPLKTQLIEPSHKGVAGVYKMNQYVHQKVHGNISDLSKRPMVGDKIMFTSTDYNKGYVNGDIGMLRHMTKNHFVFDDFENTTTIPISEMKNVTLAYSYTIHKSQGSENEHVIIFLPDEMAHMMTRSLLYTSVTRAKKRVTIVYTGDALRKSVANTRDIRRNTKLCEYLVNYYHTVREHGNCK